MRSVELNTQTLAEGETYRVTKSIHTGPALMHGFHYNNNHYELIILMQGTCYCYVEDRVYTMRPVSAALMNRGSGHFHDFDPEGERRYFHIYFNNRYADYFQRCTSLSLWDAIPTDEAVQLDEASSAVLTGMLEEMASAQPLTVLERAAQSQRLNLFFLQLTATIKSPCPTSGGRAIHSAVIQVLSELRKNYAQNLSFEGEAARLALNKSYLCRLIRRETGMTFSENLTRIRLNAACCHLATGKSVEETASLCGFAGAGYFCRVFKRVYGLTPHAYAVSGAGSDASAPKPSPDSL